MRLEVLLTSQEAPFPLLWFLVITPEPRVCLWAQSWPRAWVPWGHLPCPRAAGLLWDHPSVPVGCLSPRAGRAGQDCHLGSPPPSTGDWLERVHSVLPPHPESSGHACQRVCRAGLEPGQARAEATLTVLSRPALGGCAALLALSWAGSPRAT